MITPTTPVTINTTANGVAIGLQIVPRFTANGVTAAVTITLQQYNAANSSSPATKLGDPITRSYPDIFAAAETDANLATAMGAIMGAIQAWITATHIV